MPSPSDEDFLLLVDDAQALDKPTLAELALHAPEFTSSSQGWRSAPAAPFLFRADTGPS